ncbi:hypothetical protein F3Y22_tig00110847pilonHSYRG00124 [Hibiscus syriacus]|uniref:Disease resistance R13L4/SHOC-2-like LRR domain-containing protein n=2 Tax=Hibiscus syriacus TaxID=106335 RepID=A0A6A2ZM87_HIBSY|nr:hypothetical protein F3Y22_tig00110847pilonHSYRG00124 [Hibiscus syriacus]
MSSTNSKDPSNPKEDTSSLVEKITGRIDNMWTILSEAKNDTKKAFILKPEEEEKGVTPNAFDKACNELKYLLGEFKKLGKFETNLSEPIKTLEDNVNDILSDLEKKDAQLKKLIENNLNVLRSNITKLKVQIPLQHQASSSISKDRYAQTMSAGRDVSVLPDPFEADGIFDSEAFLKEFERHYGGLDLRRQLCLLSFAIFPENAVVRKRLLGFWWEGEWLLSSTKTEAVTDKDKKVLINKILGEFVEKGFIEPDTKSSKSQTTSYKMHPIIRCLIIRFAHQANFFYFNSKGYPNKAFFKSDKICLVKTEGPSWWSKNVPLPKKFDPTEKTNQQGKISAEEKKMEGEEKKMEGEEERKEEAVENQKKEEATEKKRRKEKGAEKRRKDEDEARKRKEEEKKKMEAEKEAVRLSREKRRGAYLEKVQTLFNVSKQFPDLPDELFSKMKNIGVLYLGRWERTAERHMEVENTDFLQGLKNMKKLRFFSLQGISGIDELPESLGNLYNLRILDLRACHNLVKLPKEIGSLKMLTFMDLSECYLLEDIPRDLSKLSNLLVLKGFVISKNSSCRLRDLTKLKNLKKLTININDDDFKIDSQDTESIFFSFEKLEKLKIAWGAGGEGSKSTNEKNGNSKQSDKGKKSEAPKSTFGKAFRKLKIGPLVRVRGGEGSSKSFPEKKGVATTPKQNMELRKLDLQCYPDKELPPWLVPHRLTLLERLYIKGGKLSSLGPIDRQCKVKTLRLKYLINIKINWKEIQTQFPGLEYLEKVKCPQIALCPCDATGVWVKKESDQTPKSHGGNSPDTDQTPTSHGQSSSDTVNT